MNEHGDGDGHAEEPAVRYFALLGNGGTAQNATGLVRRTRTRPPTDEVIGNDLAWHPTEYLRLYHLGHNDIDHAEITADAAAALLERWRIKWAARSSDSTPPPGP